VLRRHEEQAVSLACRFVRDRDDAEDIVQDAAVSMLQKHHWRDADCAKASFLVAVDRRARNWLRNRSNRRRLLAAHGDAISMPPTPLQILIAKETGAKLRTVVDALPERQRELWQLCEVDGYTYKEAAARLRIAPRTAANHLSRARERIRSALRTHRDGARADW
jgi:RNA polymerase sigma factor (sigma-70 family)